MENEKAARMNAEENAATLVRQRELDEKKMRELEAIRTQLEELLDEERQAKKDEEIVRTLQVRQRRSSGCVNSRILAIAWNHANFLCSKSIGCVNSRLAVSKSWASQ